MSTPAQAPPKFKVVLKSEMEVKTKEPAIRITLRQSVPKPPTLLAIVRYDHPGLTALYSVPQDEPFLQRAFDWFKFRDWENTPAAYKPPVDPPKPTHTLPQIIEGLRKYELDKGVLCELGKTSGVAILYARV